MEVVRALMEGKVDLDTKDNVRSPFPPSTSSDTMIALHAYSVLMMCVRGPWSLMQIFFVELPSRRYTYVSAFVCVMPVCTVPFDPHQWDLTCGHVNGVGLSEGVPLFGGFRALQDHTHGSARSHTSSTYS